MYLVIILYLLTFYSCVTVIVQQAGDENGQVSNDEGYQDDDTIRRFEPEGAE